MTAWTAIPLLLVGTLLFLAYAEDLELNLNRDLFISFANDTCGQLTCFAKGNELTIEKVTLNRLKEGKESIQLFTITNDHPRSEIIFDNLHGSGTFEKNLATIQVTLSHASNCVMEDAYTCDVTYVTQSDQRKTAFTMTGTGRQHFARPNKAPDMYRAVSAPGMQSTFYLSELGYVNQKLNRAEGNLGSFGEKVDKKLEKQEKALQEKILTLETEVASKLTKFEGRSSSLPVQDPTLQHPNNTEVEDTLTHLASRVDNLSKMVASVNTTWDKVCEYGMGNDVTKTYPAYVILDHAFIQKQILCDTKTDGGGWIVIQRRTKGDVDFFRDWQSYRDGFGSPTGDFWLGNEAIHNLTNTDKYVLRIVIRHRGQEFFAQYDDFRIEDESDRYRLRLGSYTGTAEDGLDVEKDQPFSTQDFDNEHGCVARNKGAWWYQNCYRSHLNGQWMAPYPTGLTWKFSINHVYYSEMKIRQLDA